MVPTAEECGHFGALLVIICPAPLCRGAWFCRDDAYGLCRRTRDMRCDCAPGALGSAEFVISGTFHPNRLAASVTTLSEHSRVVAKLARRSQSHLLFPRTEINAGTSLFAKALGSRLTSALASLQNRYTLDVRAHMRTARRDTLSVRATEFMASKRRPRARLDFTQPIGGHAVAVLARPVSLFQKSNCTLNRTNRG